MRIIVLFLDATLLTTPQIRGNSVELPPEEGLLPPLFFPPAVS